MAGPETGVYLRQFLRPIQAWLDQDNVSEVCVNRPGEVWIEEQGGRGMTRKDVPALSKDSLTLLAGQVAAGSHQAGERAHAAAVGRAADRGADSDCLAARRDRRRRLLDPPPSRAPAEPG